MSKTLLSQIKGFVTSQNNSGKNGLVFVERCIVHMFEHGDWTPLAWLLAKSQGTDKARLRAIVGQCVGGMTISSSSKEAKKQPSGMIIKLGDNAGPTEKIDILRKLIEDGESFRGKAVSTELLKQEAKEFDLHGYAVNFYRKMNKEGFNMKDFLSEVGKAQTEMKEKAA